MPNCLNCRRETSGTNLCAACANTLPPGHKVWKDVKVDPEYGRGGITATPTHVVLQTLLEDAGKIESGGDSTLKANMASWVSAMCIYLSSRGYWSATAGTDPGAQNTPNACKLGTTSLDFQGIRVGTAGTVWIDLQGQVGGGGTKRKSYCQVMIQTCLGGPVSENSIVAALLQSLQAGKKRALIFPVGGTGRPL